MRMQVGKIEGHDVLYIPEKHIVFCKNTAVLVPLMEDILDSSTSRHTIPDKNLTITKHNGVIKLGCLCTTESNLFKIRKTIQIINGNDTYPKH